MQICQVWDRGQEKWLGFAGAGAGAPIGIYYVDDVVTMSECPDKL